MVAVWQIAIIWVFQQWIKYYFFSKLLPKKLFFRFFITFFMIMNDISVLSCLRKKSTKESASNASSAQVPEYLSASNAQVPIALSDRVPKRSSSDRVRWLPWVPQVFESLGNLGVSISQLVSQPVTKLVYYTGSVK